MSPPRVTVGLPVFNGERYLAETIDSILAQDYEDLELLVADNASTDGTREIVQAYAEADPRVRLLTSDSNRGAAWNYNRLVHAAAGELFKWAGYDDLLLPGYLTACVQALDGNAAAVLAYPETVIIDASGEVAREYTERLVVDHGSPVARVGALARRVNLCNACFGVIRREPMLRTGLIRPYVSSDVTFLAELAAVGTFARVDDRLFARRVHATSSRQGHVTLREVAQWFDTSREASPRAPRLRLAGSTASALLGVPLPAHQRLGAALGFVATYGYRRSRIAAGRLRATMLRRSVPGVELIHSLEGSK